VSQHLRVLKGAGLVTARREGTRHLYAIDPDGLASLRTYLEGFWDDALRAFADAAEASDIEVVRENVDERKGMQR
jgi:DNA-binding transcriptional ArsR family regulator